MTSGNILNVEKALSINGFDENLFIDEVDHEFCFRTTENRYTILQDYRIAINHTLGIKTKKGITLYAPIRLYYMIRNYLYLKNKYYKVHRDFFEKRERYLLKFYIKQFIFSKERFKAIKMTYLGISDYKRNKFGRVNYV